MPEMGERTASLEALVTELRDDVKVLIIKVDSLTVELTTLKTERRVVVGIAGVLGGMITLLLNFIGKWFLTKGG